MERTEYELKSSTEHIVKKEAGFECRLTEEFNTLEQIQLKFKKL